MTTAMPPKSELPTDPAMFCFQCEQAKNGTGCTVESSCGKTPEVAALQDLLVYALKGMALVAVEGRKHDLVDPTTDTLAQVALFATLTNTNFDGARIAAYIEEVVERREGLKAAVAKAGGPSEWPEGPACFTPAENEAAMVRQGQAVSILSDIDNEDLRSLRETLIYGLKGLAAYAHHAMMLGQRDEKIDFFVHEALAAASRTDLSVDEWLGMILRCGEINLLTMEILDRGHTETFGHPVPTEVGLGHRKGKAILVSGHDLTDLHVLLQQTEGKGIDVYTHGEMLPAHGYPGLKQKYPHLVGHYGGAWQNQVLEFGRFPGPILMTTNCIVKPRESYKARIFTQNSVGWEGAPHVQERDYSELIACALEMPGFEEDVSGKNVLVGFGHNSVLGVADKVIDAVKGGAIRHFFLVGGCDGARPGRNYYTEFVEKVPEDCVVMTLACGKFRFFDQELGDIGGIPRLLDMGQCNDAYSAVKVALALADAFECGVNDLPLTLVLSWFEQKAVSVLLSLLYLGVKGIKIGPTLPAFISPGVLNVLVEKFELAPISTADADLAAALG